MTTSIPSHVDALVVGAGFSGMYQLHRLRQLGLDVHAIEGGDGVGGVWYWNRYPGARCDVPSLSYSYSFSPELDQDWNWTEKYATQPEILRYLEHVADRFDLRKDMTFGTWVTDMDFDEDTARWTVRTDDGATVSARFVVMASGVLTKWKQPEVPGIDDFGGETHHTARWPHEGVDFTGKRVAVIGTGSTGIQLIPLLAEQAQQLTVFQRTANFVLPAWNRALDTNEITEVKAEYPAWRELQRSSRSGIPSTPPTDSTFDVHPNLRRERFEAGWNSGSVLGVITAFNDILADARANEVACDFIRTKIRSIVTDAQTAEDLCPAGYAYGTKRPALGTNYYETYNRDNVMLVNLRRTPMEALTASGVRTTEAEYEFDAIVFATGFDALTGALTQIDIRGRGGRLLRDKWANGPQVLLGLMSADFPNLFMVTGPTGPASFSNNVVVIEHDVEWITDCIGYLCANDIRTFEPKPDAESSWVQRVTEIVNGTLFENSESWYTGANVAGKARVLQAYLGGFDKYSALCAEASSNDYQSFDATAAVVATA
ncbi:flavin-containing monooxygenase [Nocardia salmonicida]